MKIRAEGAFRVAVAVTYVVAAYFAFSAYSAYFAHNDTSEGVFGLTYRI
mgnify:FL=1